MSKANKRAREELIRLYGAECFIDKLHLRPDTGKRIYKGKAQAKRMRKLTYHHIHEKRRGGQASTRNGALLSLENHEWFNQQSPERQRELNQAFQDYKAEVDRVREISIKASIFTSDSVIQEEEISYDSSDVEIIPVYTFTPEEQEEYERRKEERNRRVFQKFGKTLESKTPEERFRTRLFSLMMRQIVNTPSLNSSEDSIRLELMDFMTKIIGSYDLVKQELETNPIYKNNQDKSDDKLH